MEMGRKRSISERIFTFIENALFLTVFSVVAGLVGVFVYGPVLVLCTPLVLLALHRSQAISDIEPKWYQFVIYLWIGIFAGGILLGAGNFIDRHRDHVPTLGEIAGIVRGPVATTEKPFTPPTPSAPPPSPPHHRPPSKEVVVTSVRPTHLAGMAGENTTAYIKLGVNATESLPVHMYQMSAIATLYPDDGAKQAAFEDGMWNELLEHEKQSAVPLQLSAHNQDMGIPVAYQGVTITQFNSINTGQYRYYFLVQLRKIGTSIPVLDVCFYFDRSGTVGYCRYHNN